MCLYHGEIWNRDLLGLTLLIVLHGEKVNSRKVGGGYDKQVLESLTFCCVYELPKELQTC